MENEQTNTKPLKGKQKSPNHGGARPGAGRPAGSKQHISVKELLETVENKSGGQSYTEMLVEDFLEARSRNDHILMMKYHQLILQKVFVNVSRIEISEDQDAIESKKAAFAAALAELTGINEINSQNQDK